MADETISHYRVRIGIRKGDTVLAEKAVPFTVNGFPYVFFTHQAIGLFGGYSATEASTGLAIAVGMHLRSQAKSETIRALRSIGSDKFSVYVEHAKKSKYKDTIPASFRGPCFNN